MNKAAEMLARVLRKNGMLLVSFSTGMDNVIQFNAHRICTPTKALAMFNGLKVIDEKYALSDKLIDRQDYDRIGRPYAYGCYRLTKL